MLGELITSSAFKPCFSCGKPTSKRHHNATTRTTTPCCEVCYERLNTFAEAERQRNVLKLWAIFSALLALAALIYFILKQE